MDTVDAIEVVAVDKSYGQLRAVAGVTLSVKWGSAFGMVGPNGAGKSTLVRLLCGVARADAGMFRLAGADPWARPDAAKSRCGCVPELLPLFELLTGVEYLAWAGRLRGVSETTLQRRIDELAGALELSNALSRRIVTYSRGMRQKLAFAAALVHDPRILILDEPFEGVDVIGVRSMKGMIRQFVEAGTAVFLSSHILPLVEDVCDRFGIMAQGQLLFDGDRAALEREAAQIAAGGATASRPLESVLLGLVSPAVVARLETIATS